jgi:two-component system sensor histidine kinase GlrK
MTHNKVPAVQLLIIAMLYQTQGETSSKAPPLFTTKPGFYPALLYLTG